MNFAALILAVNLWQGWFLGGCPASPKLRECAAGRPCRTDFVQTFPGLCGMKGDDPQEFGARTIVAATFDGALDYAAEHGLDTAAVFDAETGVTATVQIAPAGFAGE